MTTDDDGISEPKLTRSDLLDLDDPYFTPETVAIVTGAASGIGQAVAIGLAVNDLTVIATDVDDEGLDETSTLAQSLDADGEIVTAAADLTDDAAVEAMVETASDHGAMRFVANIAGLQHIAPLTDFPMDWYDQLHNVMVRAPFLISKLVLPQIQATSDGVGVIGNMSSVHGHYATKAKPAYIVSKFAIRGLTQAIAAEGNGSIRSFSVSAGYVKTPLMVNQIQDTATERGITEQEVIEEVMLGQARLKELMTPAEVANLFTFGMSRYGRHLNGGDLLWDGGYVRTYE